MKNAHDFGVTVQAPIGIHELLEGGGGGGEGERERGSSSSSSSPERVGKGDWLGTGWVLYKEVRTDFLGRISDPLDHRHQNIMYVCVYKYTNVHQEAFFIWYSSPRSYPCPRKKKINK